MRQFSHWDQKDKVPGSVLEQNRAPQFAADAEVEAEDVR